MSELIIQSRRAIYVGGLEDNVKEPTLRAAMIPFGPIKSIDIPMDYVKGVHKGFAFVEYEDADDAAEAIDNMDGAELMGKVLSVSVAQPNQLKDFHNKAVWSTDEWFQKQAGIQSEAQQKENERQEQDRSELSQQIQLKQQ
eukprot:CAMPEP_0202479060 /NCGR_PEP_ID=MMETSP1360-20130828/94787_1 /ASSEMBLY_ACC=CAM_ASM_000848 /TAXON_ID=515479 /ORGANISM="Licmophora paradoxa, Strain CCMP2313" /LENGTH=140 /DNA_ID=CAMNT_0049106369 /DNA_START=32 /DNA_END=454 /DNA_ORIENTATION=+